MKKNIHLSNLFIYFLCCLSLLLSFYLNEDGSYLPFSMDFKDLKNLSKNIKHINIILGKIGKKKFVKSEVKSRKFARRSIVVKKDLKKNKIITENDIIALRPNIGISVENWNKVLGKRTKKNLTKNKTLAMKDLK